MIYYSYFTFYFILILEIIFFIKIFDKIVPKCNTTKMEPYAALKQLNLTEKEIKVYLAMLPLGEASVTDIATASGLKRANLYNTLETLREKHLVLKLPHAKKLSFIAKNPRDLVTEVQERAQAVASVLPNLLSLTSHPKSNILHFEGAHGYEAAYRYVFQNTSNTTMLCFWAYSPDNPKKNNAYIRAITRRFDEIGKRKTKVRAILPVNTKDIEQFIDTYARRFGWQTRYLPHELYKSLMSVDVQDDLIMTVSRQQNQTIIIRNSDMADQLRMIFEMVWAYTEGFDTKNTS